MGSGRIPPVDVSGTCGLVWGASSCGSGAVCFGEGSRVEPSSMSACSYPAAFRRLAGRREIAGGWHWAVGRPAEPRAAGEHARESQSRRVTGEFRPARARCLGEGPPPTGQRMRRGSGPARAPVLAPSRGARLERDSRTLDPPSWGDVSGSTQPAAAPLPALPALPLSARKKSLLSPLFLKMKFHLQRVGR